MTQEELQEFVEKVINFNADELEVDRPKAINVDLDELDLAAGFLPNEFCIHYDYSEDVDRKDILFEISHEMRHVWQWQNYPELFESYKPRDLFENRDDYNMQLAEIDANAWGIVVCSNVLGLRPLLNGLSDDVQIEIDKYINEMYR